MRLCSRCNRPLVEHDAEGSCPDIGGAAMITPAEVTAETVTDEQIKELRDSLPAGHYARQWTIDAMVPSRSHPHRQSNARRECAAAVNARNAKGSR